MRPYGPLRGRDEELAYALGVVRRMRMHGPSEVALILGEAGIGKTALLSEICYQAGRTHLRVAEPSATKSNRPALVRRLSGYCAPDVIRF